ncbi:L-sulfolactate dehydrogenase [Methanobrevibacter curvatus]|uniref:Putative oxidoreductase YjmC n=1 Tax=Methanobrevibacter curvatus TaxID=49547 RepID=A0A166D7R4_9EURY|nr:L-sulfolactate dehydrogenase [Methanobrevibacter curvatus]KZX15293.1 putative oxidoreductase YjmC [Methanobrevibacter curvatus]
MKIKAEDEKKLVFDILTKWGLNKENATIVADATLDADLKGFTSHGLGRFPQYIRGIEHQTININADIKIEKETEAIALINGNLTFGQVSAYKAMKIAIKKAKKLGIAAVGTHNSNHFGVTGFYSDLALKESLIGITIANTEPAIAPLGGKTPVLGTNPIAISIPSEKTYIATDMATASSARGKLLEAQRKGHEISEGIGLDKNGIPTTDPTEALKGSILPFGGHKGYALAFMIEILTGPLVGAGYGTGVCGTADTSVKCTKGDLFIAIDPDKFVGKDIFEKETEKFVEEIRETTPNTVVPGDIESKKVSAHKDTGLQIDSKLHKTLTEICEKLDLNFNDYLCEK